MIAIRLFLFLSLCSFAADFQAGAASVDITPPAGVPMAGYYFVRYNEGTHDPLHAKALVFEKDGRKAALVALDLIGVPAEVAERARVFVEGLTSVPGANLMVSATHSHTGPEMGSRLRNVDAAALAKLQAWRLALPAKIAEAVKAAEANLQPVRVQVAVGHEDSVSFIRRFRMVDGSVAWNPGKMNPKVQTPIGSIDPAVRSLFLSTMAGAPVAAYVNFANHLDTVGGLRFSADYAYALSGVIDAAKAANPKHVTLFTLGCGGNINHIDVRLPDPQKGPGEAARIGAILGAAALKSQPGAAVLGSLGSIRTQREIIPLPLAEYKPEEVAEAREILANYGAPNAKPFYDQVRAFKILELDARKGKPIDAEVQVITLGDQVAFVGLPGEIFVDLGRAIQARSRYPFTFVVSLANGSIGYVPDRKAYPEGAYEVISTRVREGGGELLVDGALRLLGTR